ncbi:MAG: DUF721 domain-containing protein [Pseudomonadota bacterium]
MPSVSIANQGVLMSQTRSTRPIRKPPPAIGRAAAEIMRGVSRRTKYADPSLVENWPTLVGVDIANLCRPGRITGHPGSKTVELFAISGAAAMELQQRTDEILAALQGYLGLSGASRIAIRQMSHAEARDDDSATALDAALAAFRQSVGKSGRR